jgi:hypothetical protein
MASPNNNADVTADDFKDLPMNEQLEFTYNLGE